MSSPAGSSPIPAAPIRVTGDGLALGSVLGPDGTPAGLITITAAGGLVRTEIALTAEHIDAFVESLRKLRQDMPGGGIVAATAADLGRLNGRH
jgi:hypothetical protein